MRRLFLEFLLVDAFANFAKEPLMPPTGDGWNDSVVNVCDIFDFPYDSVPCFWVFFV